MNCVLTPFYWNHQLFYWVILHRKAFIFHVSRLPIQFNQTTGRNFGILAVILTGWSCLSTFHFKHSAHKKLFITVIWLLFNHLATRRCYLPSWPRDFLLFTMGCYSTFHTDSQLTLVLRYVLEKNGAGVGCIVPALWSPVSLPPSITPTYFGSHRFMTTSWWCAPHHRRQGICFVMQVNPI